MVLVFFSWGVWLDGGTAIRHAVCMAELKLTVRVDDALLLRVKRVALEERKTVSEIVRGLLESYARAKESG